MTSFWWRPVCSLKLEEAGTKQRKRRAWCLCLNQDALLICGRGGRVPDGGKREGRWVWTMRAEYGGHDSAFVPAPPRCHDHQRQRANTMGTARLQEQAQLLEKMELVSMMFVSSFIAALECIPNPMGRPQTQIRCGELDLAHLILRGSRPTSTHFFNNQVTRRDWENFRQFFS